MLASKPAGRFVMEYEFWEYGELDIWIGAQANSKIGGIICTIDLDKKDLENKILIGCTESEVQTIIDFHNSGGMRAFLIQR
jgi:inorganic pyrophosphatase